MHRRTFLRAAAGLAGPLYSDHLALSAQGPSPLATFDPDQWLRRHHVGRFETRTPQSDKPLQPLAARSQSAWEPERRLYEKALRELIGPWPPHRAPLEAVVLEKHVTMRWARYKVAFRSTASGPSHASQIRAWLFVPARPAGPRPALVTLHQTVPQGKDEPANVRASLPWLTFATYYAERGYVTLAPDMIGYGERTAGGYAQTGFEWADAAPVLEAHPGLTLIGLMLYDVTRAVDYLASRPEVDPKRIGIIGHSQGGFLTNFVLGLEPRLQVGIASCGYGLFRKDQLFPERWAARNSAYLPRLHLYRGKADDLPLDFLQIMALAAPRAHLIQTAMGDSIWTRPAVADDPFVMNELRRLRTLYGHRAEHNFVAVEPYSGANDRDHGWYPEGQAQADKLLERVLHPYCMHLAVG
jgi:dienelactone hydrolase